ncbi:MAG: hypothetical protein AAFW60_13340 [Pseudomonadota bacterium]
MNSPDWLKPGIYGAVVGAAALAIVGFSWGGWLTGSSARELADDTARDQVVAALVPICVEQSKSDPGGAVTLAELRDASSYQRRNMLMETGWATMPGSSEPDRNVASACMEKLAAQF